MRLWKTISDGWVVCGVFLALYFLHATPAYAGAIVVEGPVANPAATSYPGSPRMDKDAYWQEIWVCAAVLKTTIAVDQPLLAGTPLDSLADLPVTCSGTPGRKNFPQGVRSMLQSGYRISAISHQVTPLATQPKINTALAGTELLISALFTMELPRVAPTVLGGKIR